MFDDDLRRFRFEKKKKNSKYVFFSKWVITRQISKPLEVIGSLHDEPTLTWVSRIQGTPELKEGTPGIES